MKLINRFKGFLVIYLITILAAFGMIARVNLIESEGIETRNMIAINE